MASFDGPPEGRKGRADNGSFISISSTKQNMYPFTIYHANTSIPRRYTLYTHTPAARTSWYSALVDAIGVRKARQDANKVFALPRQSSTCLIIKPSGMGHKRLTTASSACLRAPHLLQGCILLVIYFVPLIFVCLLAFFPSSNINGWDAQHFKSGIILLPAVPMVFTLVSVLILVSRSLSCSR